MVYAVEYPHSAKFQSQCAKDRYDKVNGKDPAGADAYARMQLAPFGADGLGCKQTYITGSEYGQYYNRKENYPQTAYPLCKAAPEEQSVG